MVEGRAGGGEGEAMRRLEDLSFALHPLVERPFSEAWLRGIGILGEHSRFFHSARVSAQHSFRARPPNVALIKKHLDELSSSDAVFLAAMVSFFNGDAGGKLLRGLGASGLSDIAVSLNEERRQVLADMLVSYPGW